MTRRDTLACDSQFSSLGSRYTRFRISLIQVLKPQNAMTCGYLCKSIHLTALPMPKTFLLSTHLTSDSCQIVFFMYLFIFYFKCTSCHYIKRHTKKTKMISPGWVSSILWILLSNDSTESNFRNGSFKMNRFTSQIMFYHNVTWLSLTRYMSKLEYKKGN